MNRNIRNMLAAASLAAAALGTAACEPPRKPVEVDWTFAGKDCAAAGIATIQIDVEGEVLTPNRYACQDTGGHVITGAQIGSYLFGAYNVTVSGLDSAGNVIYASTQQIHVTAKTTNQFAIDVSPTPATTGTIQLAWTFAGQSCAQSGVTAVHVRLDGQPILDAANNAELPCNSGSDGTSLSPVDPGTHRLDLEGVKGGKVAYSLSNVMTPVTAGQTTSLSENLISVSVSSASAQVKWTFAGLSCAEGKVTSVRVLVDGVQNGSDYPCSISGADAGLVTNLTPGDHAISLTAIRAAGNTLAYRSTTPTNVSVSNGLTTQVLIDVPSASPGVGGAKLLWTGGVCSSTTTAATISYKITPPGGSATMGTSSCGGAPGGGGNAGIEFCNPSASGCPAGSPGLMAGSWTIDATATAAGTTSTATAVHFGVPNAEENTTNVTFN